MKKLIELTITELNECYKKGCEWMDQNMQAFQTEFNKIGKAYNHKQWIKGLKRIEIIEDEFKNRGIKIK